MEIYGLRCACHPQDGVRYVGRTIKGAAGRLYGHRYGANHGGSLPVHAWIRKHGGENIYPEILAVAGSLEELSRLECEWIERLYPQGNLLNLIVAESGAYVYTDEVRAKIGAAMQGRTHSDETRAKLSAAGKGRKLSDEHRAKLATVAASREFSDETRAKIGAARLGRKHSDEARAKISAAAQRRRYNGA